MKDWEPWWVGQINLCSKCGCKIQLESGDDNSRYWIPVISDHQYVSFICHICGEVNKIQRFSSSSTVY